jgi:hypothetical protein
MCVTRRTQELEHERRSPSLGRGKLPFASAYTAPFLSRKYRGNALLLPSLSHTATSDQGGTFCVAVSCCLLRLNSIDLIWLCVIRRPLQSFPQRLYACASDMRLLSRRLVIDNNALSGFANVELRAVCVQGMDTPVNSRDRTGLPGEGEALQGEQQGSADRQQRNTHDGMKGGVPVALTES